MLSHASKSSCFNWPFHNFLLAIFLAPLPSSHLDISQVDTVSHPTNPSQIWKTAPNVRKNFCPPELAPQWGRSSWQSPHECRCRGSESPEMTSSRKKSPNIKLLRLEDAHQQIQGDFFNWSRPKSSKCWRWQNPYQKRESKGISQRKYEVLIQTFTFLVGILPSPTLRTFRAGPVKKVTL